MKKLRKSKEKKLVKTTMAAMFITALMLISSVNAAPVVTQQLNDSLETEFDSMQTQESKIPMENTIIGKYQNRYSTPFALVSDDNQQKSTPAYRTVILEEGFEGGAIPAGWLNVDNDSDGYIWNIVSPPGHPPHSGTYSAMSESWNSGVGPLNPDNWLITSVINLTTTDDVITLSYWVAAQDPDWSQEHLEVWISTTNQSISSFTTQIDDYTCPPGTSDYFQRVVDLTSYKNEPTVYLAFRHCESTDWFQIKIDDILVYSSSDDVGVESIEGLESGQAVGALTPRVIVKNYGVNDLEDVPVNLKLGISNLQIFFQEDFETGVPGSMTHNDYNSGVPNDGDFLSMAYGAYHTECKPRSGNYYAIGDAWGFPSGQGSKVYDDGLETPILDLSSCTSVWLGDPIMSIMSSKLTSC